MIVFKKIRYKNILSTGNVFTEIALNEVGTTLIVGENGAGKSTILDALSFVLFGKAFRNINKPQLINSITQKNLVVEVEFSVGSNNYKIIRGMKPNVFEVYQNDVLLNQSAESKDYQEILEKQIIKVNHKSFCQVVVLGSATFQPFMQLPAGRRREIIEDLLDLQIFTTMNSILKSKTLVNSENLIKVQADKKLIEEKIKLIKEHLIELQQNNDKIIEEKKLLVEDTKQQIEILKEQYFTLQGNREELLTKILEEENFSNKINLLGQLKHKIEANLSVIKKEINFFNKHDNCPTCKQAIDNNFKCETVEKKTKEVDEYNDGLSKLVKQYEEVQEKLNEIDKVRKQINEVNLQINTNKTKINTLESYCRNLEKEIQSINNSKKEIDDSKIPELEKELEIIKNKNIELIEEKNILAVAGTLLKDGGIKSRIIKQYVPIINKLINKYLSAMEFMCQFELDENFNETIKSRYRDEFSYSSFSEGEKQKIDVALLFTWRALAKLRNSINTNLLIFDEILDSSLDTNSIEYFLNIINNLANDGNVFIISHREHVSDKFENIIRFEKHKNFSKIAA